MRRWNLSAGASGLDDLGLVDGVAIPEPEPDEVRVKVHATSLNYRDQLIMRGDFGTLPRDIIPLSDGAGEIDAVGAEVTRWSVGDRVAGLYFRDWYSGPPTADVGGWGLGSTDDDGMPAEYVTLKPNRVTRIPERYSYAQAATLPCAAVTAWTALYEEHPIRSGEKILVIGTGGVSMFALLLGKAAGAQVLVTSSQDAKLDRARALGADDGVNYREQANWGEVVFQRTGGVDKIVNAAGASTLDQSFMALAPGGEVATMGLFDFGDAAPTLPLLMSKGGSIRGTAVGGAKNFEDLVAAIDVNHIEPPIAGTFAFDQARAAYAEQAGADVFGKIVIEV